MLERTGRAAAPTPARRRTLQAALLLGLFLLIALPSAASATNGLTTGFSGDNLLTAGSSSRRAVWLQRAVHEGAGFIRVGIDWSQVAPAQRPTGFDPANPASRGYRWGPADAVIRQISARGLRVLVQISDAPRWAEGASMPSNAEAGTWKPNAVQFADFAEAAARRYSGTFPDPLHRGQFLPRVVYWQAWNEENLAFYLSPQWVRQDGHWVAASPNIYRNMLNGFYTAVKSVNPSNVVVMGGTAPFGDPPGYSRMRPVTFDQDLFCIGSTLKLTSCPGPVYLDAVDHHPYNYGPPTTKAYYADDAAVPDVWKITRLLDAGVRAGTVLPDNPKQVWVTEIAWDSDPPGKGVGSVSLAKQARYLEQGLYLLWHQGVTTIMWLQIRDSAPRHHQDDAFPWSGLYFLSGKAKPAATAFRFPFVTNRLNAGTVQAWGRAPVAGTLTISRREKHGGWQPLEHLQVAVQQVFLTTLHLDGGATLRAQVDGQASLSWYQRR